MSQIRRWRWLTGPALFLAGLLAGILIMQPTALTKEKAAGIRLNHIGFYVKNMDESKEFYTKKMGFREAFTFKDADGNPIDYFQINHDTFIEITPATAQHPVGFGHAGIWADDVEATVASLQQKGVKAEDVHLGMTKARISNVIDPNGMRYELLAYPPESLQGKAIASWK